MGETRLLTSQRKLRLPHTPRGSLISYTMCQAPPFPPIWGYDRDPRGDARRGPYSRLGRAFLEGAVPKDLGNKNRSWVTTAIQERWPAKKGLLSGVAASDASQGPPRRPSSPPPAYTWRRPGRPPGCHSTRSEGMAGRPPGWADVREYSRPIPPKP